ncbi:hypothetical protein FRB99_003201 [Tulasnella sp. 403]|nr:hypothetical protein FRB99_003201 [Tulasnella sp. 403]
MLLRPSVFAKWGRDVFSCVSWDGRPIIYLADPDLIQRVNGNAHHFPKPVEEYGVLNFFGPNLVTAAGKDWRRQQSVSKGVFNNDGWRFLWQETCNIFDGMMKANKWDELPAGAEIKIEHAVDITLRVALLAIGRAGFGMKMTWVEDMNSVVTGDHTMSFQTALHTVAQSSILKLALPNHIRTAFKELEMYIRSMTEERQKILRGEVLTSPDDDARCDLFHNLIKASMEGDEQMSTEELVGNIYIYLLAGHETTAHSIAFTFALLALWPEKQRMVYEEVMEKMPKDGITTYDLYKELELVQGAYSETLRMCPPVQQIPKKLARDTLFVFDKSNVQNAELGLMKQAARMARAKVAEARKMPTTSTPTDASTPSSESMSPIDSADRFSPSPSTSTFLGSMFSSSTSTSMTSVVDAEDADDISRKISAAAAIPRADCVAQGSSWKNVKATEGQMELMVEKDTIVFINPPAVHYNPKYFPEPYEFKPERFKDDVEEGSFIPFSSGSRVCLGRHFSEVESVCFLAYIIREFEIHPIPAFEGETREQMLERMFKARPLITLTPESIPIMFKKRGRPTVGVAEAVPLSPPIPTAPDMEVTKASPVPTITANV